MGISEDNQGTKNLKAHELPPNKVVNFAKVVRLTLSPQQTNFHFRGLLVKFLSELRKAKVFGEAYGAKNCLRCE